MSAPKTIAVDIISDVACPWCWVGKRAIETAAANINAAAPNTLALELRWHPFQLSPELPKDTTANLIDKLVTIVGSRAEVERWIADPSNIPMNKSCKASNLPNISFSLSRDSPSFNTYRAHTLLTYTAKSLKDYEKQNALKEALLRMTHKEGKNLNDPAQLLEAGKEAGVVATAEELDKILNDSAVKSILDEELRGVRSLPMFNGVPFFTFPNGTRFSGGQPVDVFEKNLKACL